MLGGEGKNTIRKGGLKPPLGLSLFVMASPARALRDL
jgi:hypothetical protein